MTFLYSLVSITLIVTPIIIIILLATPLLDRKYAGGGRYVLWILVMMALALPFVSFIPSPVFQINVPVTINQPLPSADRPEFAAYTQPIPLHTSNIVGGTAERNTFAEASVPIHAESSVISLPYVILLIWLTGVVLSLAFQAKRYLSFVRFVRRWSVPESDPCIIAGFNAEASRMGIRKQLPLKRCKGINTPMLMGIINPTVILPDSDYDKSDLSLIFRHELIHYKRRDLWYKLALIVTKSIYWFNPAVCFMAKQANKDIETTCDMLTVRNMDMGTKKRYSELILSMASGSSIYQSRLTTCMEGDKDMLKQRFSNILGAAKKRGIVLFTAVGIIILAISLTIGFNFASYNTIAEEQAEAVFRADFREMNTIIGEAMMEAFRQPVGISKVFEEEGIRLEVISVAVVGNMMSVYFILEDLFDGGRFNEDTILSAWPEPSVPPGGMMGGPALIMEQIDDRVFMLHGYAFFSEPIESQMMYVVLGSMVYNHRSAEYEIDIDLAALIPQSPFGWAEDTPILQPNMHDIEISLEGFESIESIHSISSIGILDGRLHIQEMRESLPLPPDLSGFPGFNMDGAWSSVWLINPRGERVLPTPTRVDRHDGYYYIYPIIDFTLDEDGNILDREQVFGRSTRLYTEWVYEVDLDMLSEYRVVARFNAESWMELSGAIEFEVESDGMVLVLDDIGLEMEQQGNSLTLEEMMLTPMSAVIRFKKNNISVPVHLAEFRPFLGVRINTTDGVVATSNLGGGGVEGCMFSFENYYIIDVTEGMLDLDSIISVEIYGWYTLTVELR